MASSSSSFLGIDDTVDDFYFSVVADDDETDPNVPVSYDKYAEALQFQETVLASLITSLRIPSSSMSQPPPSLQWVAPSSQTIDEGLLFQETLVASSSTLPLSLLCVASSSQTVDEELLFEETLMASSSSSTCQFEFCYACGEKWTCNHDVFVVVLKWTWEHVPFESVLVLATLGVAIAYQLG
ncbi:hypothetical protein TSUD_46940 [Trifolium subterraneum]|nr:hypothetical protein TSUD_46940 [Trifolium subterraneum]